MKKIEFEEYDLMSCEKAKLEAVLKADFPQVYKEGRLDFYELFLALQKSGVYEEEEADVLGDLDSNKNELSKDELEDAKQARFLRRLLDTKSSYEFTWAKKASAKAAAYTKSKLSFEPLGGDGPHKYICGDNLDVLKLLLPSYANKIAMIYIDPPYNTGKDFIYRDCFKKTAQDEDLDSGLRGEDGARLVQNLASNGRYHSDWLNMIYPRLMLARQLLRGGDEQTPSGVIFISIDDNEVANLKKVCDEVFGEVNFVGQFSYMKTSTPPSLSKKIRKKFEYILAYVKSGNISLNGGVTNGGDMPLLNASNSIGDLVFPPNTIKFNIPDGNILPQTPHKVQILEELTVKNSFNAGEVKLRGTFKWGQKTLDEEIAAGTTFIIKSDKFSIRYERVGERVKVPSNLISKKECGVGTNEDAKKEILELFGDADMFDYPKPTSLLSYLINSVTQPHQSDIILDFFSGSATTGDALMRLNAADGGNRKCVLVQLEERLDENSAAHKAGFKTICDIGRERGCA